MLRPLISEKLRSTARRSAPWKSSVTGSPVKRCGCPGAGWAGIAGGAGAGGCIMAAAGVRRVGAGRVPAAAAALSVTGATGALAGAALTDGVAGSSIAFAGDSSRRSSPPSGRA